MIKFLDLHKQYLGIKEEVDAAIQEVIQDSAFIGGRVVRAFEQNFAVYQQAEFCVGVANGTDAIEIALEALGLPPGSEVIVPANSFIASSEAVTRAGHRVVFADIDSETYTLDPLDVENHIGPRTAAIIAVHLYGHPCDMEGLLALAQKHGLKVIEDCAQAHGAEYKGQRVGVIGDVGTFSFYPGKNLGAYGDAGAIVTGDESIARKCRMIANHGRINKYNHEFEGRNSRLDGIQAAVLNVKLRYLDHWIERRRRHAENYGKYLSCVDIKIPIVHANSRHVYHLYVIQIGNRVKIQQELAHAGIATGIHYPTALPLLPSYRYLRYEPKDFPIAINQMDRILSLPMYPEMTEEMVVNVSQVLKKLVQVA